MSAPCPIFGTTVRVSVRDAGDAERLLDEFTAVLTSRGLVWRGETGRRWQVVVSSEAGQMTESDREAIGAWLDAQPTLERAVVDPIGDLQGAP